MDAHRHGARSRKAPWGDGANDVYRTARILGIHAPGTGNLYSIEDAEAIRGYWMLRRFGVRPEAVADVAVALRAPCSIGAITDDRGTRPVSDAAQVVEAIKGAQTSRCISVTPRPPVDDPALTTFKQDPLGPRQPVDKREKREKRERAAAEFPWGAKRPRNGFRYPAWMWEQLIVKLPLTRGALAELVYTMKLGFEGEAICHSLMQLAVTGYVDCNTVAAQFDLRYSECEQCEGMIFAVEPGPLCCDCRAAS